jgi:hypothetical protein
MNVKTRRWEWTLADLAILGLLLFVINPELQVFLLMVDFLSLELFLFLVLIQLRSFLPIASVAINSTGKWSCILSFAAFRGILRVFCALLTAPAMSALSVLTFVWSQNLWCPLSRQSSVAHLQT